MKTEKLISLLASDRAVPSPDLRARLAIGGLAGAAVSLAVLLAFYGLRPDLGAALADWRIAVKFAFASSLALGAAAISMRLWRPFPLPGRAWLLLLPAPLILAAGCMAELATVPAVDWAQRAIGTNAVSCIVSVPLLSIGPLVGLLWALGEGAPASTRQAGLAAGGLAAGIGAAIYALHCPDDSPLFLAIWYAAAIGFVSLLGLQGGGRMLRW